MSYKNYIIRLNKEIRFNFFLRIFKQYSILLVNFYKNRNKFKNMKNVHLVQRRF